MSTRLEGGDDDTIGVCVFFSFPVCFFPFPGRSAVRKYRIGWAALSVESTCRTVSIRNMCTIMYIPGILQEVEQEALAEYLCGTL